VENCPDFIRTGGARKGRSKSFFFFFGLDKSLFTLLPIPPTLLNGFDLRANTESEDTESDRSKDLKGTAIFLS